jgi:hypothetical protein
MNLMMAGSEYSKHLTFDGLIHSIIEDIKVLRGAKSDVYRIDREFG